MSLKGVELQIAIPKTFDAGKSVEQHQQNVIQQQYNANEALKKDTEKKQLTVMNTEKIDAISEEEKESKHNEQEHRSSKKRSKKQNDQEESVHPFKGNFIDYSG